MFETDDAQQAAETTRRPERRSVTATPLDLRQCRFRTAIRGFDKDEVASFMSEAAADYEHAVRESERLREEVARLESSIGQYQDLEASFKSALISAQKVADDMRATAEQEAARIVREAEAKARQLQEGAEVRLQEMKREIEGVSLKRRHAVANIESTIAALRNTVEFIHQQDARKDDAVAAPAPRRLEAVPVLAAGVRPAEASSQQTHDELAEPLVKAQTTDTPAGRQDEPAADAREDEESVLVYQSQYRSDATRFA